MKIEKGNFEIILKKCFIYLNVIVTARLNTSCNIYFETKLKYLFKAFTSRVS